MITTEVKHLLIWSVVCPIRCRDSDGSVNASALSLSRIGVSSTRVGGVMCRHKESYVRTDFRGYYSWILLLAVSKERIHH